MRSWTKYAVVVATVVALAGTGSAPGQGPDPVRAATGDRTGFQDPSSWPDCVDRASDSAPIARLSGSDRWATATCTSQAGFPDGTDTVVLARGDDAGGWADALAGTVLATSVQGPVLLTSPTELPDATAREIRRLSPETVLVLGGTAAISRRVADEVASLGPSVERLAGAARAETAAKIAERAGTGGEAFVVNGTRPADALVAGAAAARRGAALLLVETDRVPSATVKALEGVRTITVVGGFTVVGEGAERTLRSMVGASNLLRLGGADRAETAAAVARVHPGDRTVHLVSGDNRHLVDAISASWPAALPGGGPVVYAGPDHPLRGTDRWLRLGALEGEPETRLIGGRAILSDRLVRSLEWRYEEARRGGPPAQMRALWVHLFDDSLKSRAGIERVLDAAAQANLNTVIVQVARRHDAFYQSSVLPRTTDPRMPSDLDLLGRLVPAAKARGLDVHAWFSVMPTYHDSFQRNGERLPASHIYTRHGPSGTEGSWMTTVNSSTYAYLEPAIPGVQDHVTNMITEVVRRYEVDGIHLDYLRYDGAAEDLDPPRDEHPTSMQRWRDHGGGISLDEWRRRQTADLARRIAVEVAAVDPTVVISMAAIAQGPGPSARGGFEGTNAYDRQCYGSIGCRPGKFQNWPAWFAEGVVDVVFPMAYFREPSHADWYDQWRRFAAEVDRPGATVAVGLAGYLNTPGDTLSQLGEAVASTDGVAIYSYQGDASTGQGRLLSLLPGGVFADPAPVPAVTAKQRPTTGWVLVGAHDGDDVRLTQAGSGQTLARRTDATGHAGFVRVPPGDWTVTADGRSTTIRVTAGEVSSIELR